MKALRVLIISCLCATATFAQSATDPSQDPLILTNAFFKALLDEDSHAIGKTMSGDFSLISFDSALMDGDLMVQGQPFDNTVTFSVVWVKQSSTRKITNVQFTPSPQ